MGINQLDERLIGIIKRVSNDEILVNSHQQIVQQIVSAWNLLANRVNWKDLKLPVIQLYGNETKGKRSISTTVCHQLEVKLYRISSQVIPSNLNEINLLIKLWRREAILSHAILLLEVDPIISTDISRENAIAHFIEEIDSPLIVSRQDRQPQQHRQFITFEVNKPTTQEQRHIWHQTFR